MFLSVHPHPGAGMWGRQDLLQGRTDALCKGCLHQPRLGRSCWRWVREHDLELWALVLRCSDMLVFALSWAWSGSGQAATPVPATSGWWVFNAVSRGKKKAISLCRFCGVKALHCLHLTAVMLLHRPQYFMLQWVSKEFDGSLHPHPLILHQTPLAFYLANPLQLRYPIAFPSPPST